VLVSAGPPGSLSARATVALLAVGRIRAITNTDNASSRIISARVTSSTWFSMGRLKSATRPFSADGSRQEPWNHNLY